MHWIYCDLPYAWRSWTSKVKKPNLLKEEEALFGTTLERMYDWRLTSLIRSTTCRVRHDLSKALYVKTANDPTHKVTKAQVESKLLEELAKDPKLLEYHKKYEEIRRWRSRNDTMREYRRALKDEKLNTFVGQKLNKPGVQIETEFGRILIGNYPPRINPQDRVIRYRVLLTPEDLAS